MADRNITKRLHRVARAATFALAVISLSAAAVRPAHAAEDGKTRVKKPHGGTAAEEHPADL